MRRPPQTLTAIVALIFTSSSNCPAELHGVARNLQRAVEPNTVAHLNDDKLRKTMFRANSIYYRCGSSINPGETLHQGSIISSRKALSQYDEPEDTDREGNLLTRRTTIPLSPGTNIYCSLSGRMGASPIPPNTEILISYVQQHGPAGVLEFEITMPEGKRAALYCGKRGGRQLHASWSYYSLKEAFGSVCIPMRIKE